MVSRVSPPGQKQWQQFHLCFGVCTVTDYGNWKFQICYDVICLFWTGERWTPLGAQMMCQMNLRECNPVVLKRGVRIIVSNSKAFPCDDKTGECIMWPSVTVPRFVQLWQGSIRQFCRVQLRSKRVFEHPRIDLTGSLLPMTGIEMEPNKMRGGTWHWIVCYVIDEQWVDLGKSTSIVFATNSCFKHSQDCYTMFRRSNDGNVKAGDGNGVHKSITSVSWEIFKRKTALCYAAKHSVHTRP